MNELNELKRKISASYGGADKIFALHPFDIQQGQKALLEAIRLEIGFKQYVELHRDFLVSEGVHEDHLEEQLEYVKDLSRYFIED